MIKEKFEKVVKEFKTKFHSSNIKIKKDTTLDKYYLYILDWDIFTSNEFQNTLNSIFPNIKNEFNSSIFIVYDETVADANVDIDTTELTESKLTPDEELENVNIENVIKNSPDERVLYPGLNLILYNDDFHTLEYIIHCLLSIGKTFEDALALTKLADKYGYSVIYNSSVFDFPDDVAYEIIDEFYKTLKMFNIQCEIIKKENTLTTDFLNGI